MAGLFDGLEGAMTSPLFLGGLGLATNGMAGLQGGMQSGMAYGKQKKDLEKERLFGEAAQQALQDPRFAQLGAGERQLLAASPDMLKTVLSTGLAHQFDPTAKLKEQQIMHGMRHQDATLAEQKRAHDLQYAQLKHQSPDLQLQAQMAARARAAQQAGLSPESPAFKSYYLTGNMPREDQSPLTVTDKKAILEAENELPNIKSTIEGLDRALELNKKTFTGAMAGTRGWLGSALPDFLVPDFVADPKTAENQREFDQLTRGEAIKSMATTLKGATTNQEMKEFIEILANPSTPPDVRARTLQRLKTAAQAKEQTMQARVNDMRGGDYFKAPKGSPNAVKPQTEDLSKLSTDELLKRLGGGR